MNDSSAFIFGLGLVYLFVFAIAAFAFALAVRFVYAIWFISSEGFFSIFWAVAFSVFRLLAFFLLLLIFLCSSAVWSMSTETNTESKGNRTQQLDWALLNRNFSSSNHFLFGVSFVFARRIFTEKCCLLPSVRFIIASPATPVAIQLFWQLYVCGFSMIIPFVVWQTADTRYSCVYHCTWMFLLTLQFKNIAN